MYALCSRIATQNKNKPEARFTNDSVLAIQIRWKLCLAVILLLATRPQQIFAHCMTAQLQYTIFCNCFRIGMRVKRNFHWIWNTMERPLMKWPPAQSNWATLFHSDAWMRSSGTYTWKSVIIISCNGVLPVQVQSLTERKYDNDFS